jgi:hypothetical protein
MSPAFERRLARIDKALDWIRAAREEEEARHSLALFYFRLTLIRDFGPEAVNWIIE